MTDNASLTSQTGCVILHTLGHQSIFFFFVHSGITVNSHVLSNKNGLGVSQELELTSSLRDVLKFPSTAALWYYIYREKLKQQVTGR